MDVAGPLVQFISYFDNTPGSRRDYPADSLHFPPLALLALLSSISSASPDASTPYW